MFKSHILHVRAFQSFLCDIAVGIQKIYILNVRRKTNTRCVRKIERRFPNSKRGGRSLCFGEENMIKINERIFSGTETGDWVHPLEKQSSQVRAKLIYFSKSISSTATKHCELTLLVIFLKTDQ